MFAKSLAVSVSLLTLIPLALTAQLVRERDAVPLKHWQAPLYWQPTQAEARAAQPDAGIPPSQIQSQTSSLVFVGITPCRVVDTRAGFGFTGGFGPPSLVGGASRTFPFQSSTTCTIPATALAYSFNATVVPPGPLGFITAYPTGQARPNAATVNSPLGFIVGNQAIVAAGASGSVDVFASAATDLVIDINGYYVAQNSIVLSQGTAAAPGISFSGDASTGVFSSGAGVLNFSTGGTNRLTIRADGDLDLSGNIRQGGTPILQTSGANGLALGTNAMPVNVGVDNEAIGTFSLQSVTNGNTNTAVGSSALRTTNGFGNTGVGTYALQAGTGSANTVIGAYSGQNKITGDYNVYAGFNVGSSASNTESGTIRIGDAGNNNRAFIGGIRGITTGSVSAIPVMIDSNGQLGTISSSRRYKEDIQDMADASSGLMKLRPVTYRYRQAYDDGSKPVDYGLIAEEVEEVYPDLVAHLKNGDVETVQYQKLTPMLLNEVQKQAGQIESLQSQVKALLKALDTLTTLAASKASAVPVQ